MSDIELDILSLIKNEEDELRNILLSLNEQIDRYSERHYLENLRSRELTQQLVSARREEDRQMISSDEAVSYRLRDGWYDELRILEELRDNPYFARVVLEEEEYPGQRRLIEYRLGKRANPDCRIVDWKHSPIAKLFYEYREGEEYCETIQGRERTGKVITRLKLNINKGELRAVSCLAGDFVKAAAGGWEARSGGAKKALFGNSPGSLGDVLPLVTAEQFAAITEKVDTAVMIKGIAGSGKTTVALQRLVWLLSQGAAAPIADTAAVIVKSGALRFYIEATLLELGIGKIKVWLFEEWLESELGKVLGKQTAVTNQGANTRLALMRFKNSLALVKRLESYVDGQRLRFLRLVEKHRLEIPPRLNSLVDLLKAGKVSLLKAAEEISSGLPETTLARKEIESARVRMGLYLEDLQLIYSQPELLVAQDRKDLLDTEVILQARDLLVESCREGELDASDRGPLLLLAFLKNRAKSDIPLHSHLVIDEVQDFGALELALFSRVVRGPAALTLVGDLSQATSSAKQFPGWDALREHWLGVDDQSSVVNLTVSQRLPAPIVRFAEHISGRRESDGSERPGKRPWAMSCQTENLGVREAIGWLTRVSDAYPGSLVVVICATPAEAFLVESMLKPSFGQGVRLGDENSFSFAEGIVVTSVRQVKGLEFPYVLLWNPSNTSYPKGERGRNSLYVAATRAQELLSLVIWGNPSPHLPAKDSRLWRLRTREEEETEDDEAA